MIYLALERDIHTDSRGALRLLVVVAPEGLLPQPVGVHFVVAGSVENLVGPIGCRFKVGKTSGNKCPFRPSEKLPFKLTNLELFQ